jgi:hypothetical protein
MVGTVGPTEDAAGSFAVKYHTVLEHEYRIRMLYPSTAPEADTVCIQQWKALTSGVRRKAGAANVRMRGQRRREKASAGPSPQVIAGTRSRRPTPTGVWGRNRGRKFSASRRGFPHRRKARRASGLLCSGRCPCHRLLHDFVLLPHQCRYPPDSGVVW